MSFRSAFGPIIDHPQGKPGVLYYDDNAVIIADKYPKLLRHYLVLPRHPSKTHHHPLVAFDDDRDFYLVVKRYVDKCTDLMVASLLRQFPDATSDTFRPFIQAGVHSQPLLSNLHIHVMTRDMWLPAMKHKKHYNSFATPFFVPFARLESRDGDVDSDDGSGVGSGVGDDVTADAWLKAGLRCCYCGAEFKNSFVGLKKHLDKEFRRKYGGLGANLDDLHPNQ